MTNMLKNEFNWSEVDLSEMTCYKIHTLVYSITIEQPVVGKQFCDAKKVP